VNCVRRRGVGVRRRRKGSMSWDGLGGGGVVAVVNHMARAGVICRNEIIGPQGRGCAAAHGPGVHQ
jgi:hypothetical protein